jgi:hypothetical protein
MDASTSGDSQSKTLAIRFWKKVRKAETCWFWTAATKANGYGTIGRGGRGKGMEYAHRVSWEIHNGPVPKGLMVLHKCDVRACVNPDHLFLGTCDDNLKDCAAKGRMHPGEKNAGHKLKEQDVRLVRQLAASGIVHRLIAQAFGISRGQVGRIVDRTKWRHVV